MPVNCVLKLVKRERNEPMYCRNCSKEVSDKAVACPGCGVPPLMEKKFCHNCGCETQPNQALCIKCGVNLASCTEICEILSRFSNSPIRGCVRVVIAIIIALWTSSHTPHLSFMEMMADPNHWVLKEPLYYGLLTLAWFLAIHGGINIYRHFQSGASLNKK